jgi:hypothetical protein
MRLSADAKAYAAAMVSHLSSENINSEMGPVFQELLATAFQSGHDHAKASQRRIEKLAKGKT